MDEFDKNKYLKQLAKENADMPSRPALRPIDSTDVIDTLKSAPDKAVPESELSKMLTERMGLKNLKSSMASDEEIARGLKGSMDIPKDLAEEGSRMIRPKEAAKLKARESILKRMAKRAGSGLGRKAAGLAIGGPLALMSELADASEIGISERDKIIESTEYSPDEKKALLRGLDMKRKLASESGDVSEDPTVLKAKEIGKRLESESIEGKSQEELETQAAKRFNERVSNEDYIKILRDMKNRNRGR